MTAKPNPAPNPAQFIHDYCELAKSDLFLFSGEISQESGLEFVRTVCSKKNRRPKASLFLTTNGGDPHVAYRMAKALRRRYASVRLLIAGPCKSAGTLIALGANELGFATSGELGPLDVQLTKPDEILLLGSGLDVLQALSMITDGAFERFEKFMINMVVKSGGGISTKMAAEVASNFASKLFEPISAQIDPLRLGEVGRAVKIARTYGERLTERLKNIKPNAIDDLIEGYPSHGFVIDKEEAEKLFHSVSDLTTEEAFLADLFSGTLDDPHTPALVGDLEETFPLAQTTDDSQDDDEGNAPDIGSVREVEPGEPTSASGNGTSAEAKGPPEAEQVTSSR